jgi:predicted phage baseplate assembly protein
VAGGTWRPLRSVRDDTRALLQSGIIALEVPAVADGGPTDLRIRLDRGFFPSAPRIARLELNTLPVVQLEHRAEALLPSSTGLPDQTRELPLRNLTAPGPVAPSLEIEVVGTDGWERWPATDALHDLGPDDRRIEIDTDREVVRFGNGINGKIPPPGAQIRHRTYALTLASAGNMRSGLTWRVDGQGAVLWRNRIAFSGGEDAWDAARLSLEARRRARRPDVPVDDAAIRGELLALPGFALARVEILPRYDPALPEEDLPGHRTIVVVPEIMRSRELTPEEARRYLGELRARLALSRLAGERQRIVLARCVRVRVRARLMIAPGARPDQVKRAAEDRLAAQLAPLPPEGQAGGRGWPLGRALSTGRLKGLLAGLEQVVAVTALELAGAEGGFTADDIALSAIELPRGRDHVIELERSSGA